MKQTDKQTQNALLKRIGQSDILLLLGTLAVLCAIVSILTPSFLTQRNIMNTLRQVSLTAICGFGMTMVVLLGEIDLSVGSQQAVAGLTSVVVLNATGSIALAVLTALASGVIVGAINGLLVTKLKLNSLIATLGTMSIWRGACMVVTSAVSIQSEYPEFQNLGTGFMGPFPNAFVIAFLLYLIIYYLLNHTTFGRQIYAIGGQCRGVAPVRPACGARQADRLYYRGRLNHAVGVLLASRWPPPSLPPGDGFEMTVISSVVLGGISMDGGVGSIAGALIGMLILGVLQNGPDTAGRFLLLAANYPRPGHHPRGLPGLCPQKQQRQKAGQRTAAAIRRCSLLERTPIIEIRGVHKFFPGVHALKGVDLTLYPGEVHALVGENGAGKSTLSRSSPAYTITRRENTASTAGPPAIRTPADAINQGISVIYQELNLVPCLSISENVFFGRLPARQGVFSGSSSMKRPPNI